MNFRPANLQTDNGLPAWVWVCGFLFLSQVMGGAAAVSHAQDNVPEDVRQWSAAEFVRFINLPGSGEKLHKPRAMHFDRFHDEVLLSDTGQNRIVVFRPSGAFDFQFTVLPHLNSVRDMTSDPEGYIYVLGAKARQPQVAVFDFDGLALYSFTLDYEGRTANATSLACDDQGRLYALDGQFQEILIFDTRGQALGSIPLQLESNLTNEVYGSLTVAGDDIFLPVSTQGTVLHFGLDGRVKPDIGIPGTLPGTLNFPVAVELAGPDLVLVLDKSRFVVLCYDLAGSFLGEFGGKGYRPGWFYQPTLLAVPTGEQAIVGQIFDNTVQICQIPEFIRKRAAQQTSITGAAAPLPQAAVGHALLSIATPSPRRSSSPELSATERPVHGGSHHLSATITELPSEESE